MIETIARGLAAGASVEIDLQPLSDGSFAVIHDPQLDRETTGTGAVNRLDSQGFLALHRRDNQGRALTEPALTLDQFTQRLGSVARPGAVLQLDLQCKAADLHSATVAGFDAALGQLKGTAILSGEDPAAVRRLAAAAPGLAIGYDPCGEAGQIALAMADDWTGFVRETLAAMPEAGTIYLALDLPLRAADQGFDLIKAFQQHRKRVDCFTLVGDEAEAAQIARRLVELGTDQITTDDPKGLISAFADISSQPAPLVRHR
jgi:glycerophosphoryl diester phosphodiesterase